ncbi:MAG: tyrosine-type recombinase/integrase [Cyanobacteria bacterium P01_D01_bin.115]
MSTRSGKGSVSVGSDKGWLRLRWRHRGQGYTMAIGLPDSAINRELAQRQADIIKADIPGDRVAPGTFDPTLAKYRTDAAAAMSVGKLFERYTEHKRKTLGDPRSLEKYRGLMTYLNRYFKTRSASGISESQAFEFRDWLSKQLKPITTRERVGMLRSCWEWAIKRKLVAENPWADVRVKVPPKAKPKPFTAEEIGRILEYCRAEAAYQHWADFIEFCLSIGCRPGEAAGLKWQHLADDCSSIWVGESWGRGRQKGTKTNQARAFDLFPELQAMLLKRRVGVRSEDYVFTAPQGGPIDDHNFRKRCWVPLLEELNIPYRKPYNTRHTFTSHALDQGWSVSEIAAVTGNSEETILRSYVGNPHGKAKVKRLF